MKLITVRDAARTLGISRQRVSLLCQQRVLKAERVGMRVYVIDPDSLEAYRRSASRKHTPHTFSAGRPKRKK